MNRKLCLRGLMACIALGVMLATPARACGLHPTIGGSIQSSYPGALDVAVAVAGARNAGLLPAADPLPVPDKVLLKRMLADLRQLQSRLNGERASAGDADGISSFSLVLVGPGFWSHYHAGPEGVVGEYHTDGPVEGQVVVLTHHAVLRTLLGGQLSAEQAADLGLIAFSGRDTGPVRKAWERGFESRT